MEPPAIPGRFKVLLSLITQLDSLDLLDQVEVLAACGMAGMGEAYSGEAKERLTRLPSAVAAQLAHLGVQLATPVVSARDYSPAS